VREAAGLIENWWVRLSVDRLQLRDRLFKSPPPHAPRRPKHEIWARASTTQK